MTWQLDMACMLLARSWSPGCAWDSVTIWEPDMGQGDGLQIASPNRIVEKAVRKVGADGESHIVVSAVRTWKCSSGMVVRPARSNSIECAGALAYMAPRPWTQEIIRRRTLLFLFALEATYLWPHVETALLPIWDGRPELLKHALASLMRPMKRNRVNPSVLAGMVRMRRDTYFRERRRAESLLQTELQAAAEDYLRALGGNLKFPENELYSERRKKSPRISRKPIRPWWRDAERKKVRPCLLLEGEAAAVWTAANPAQKYLPFEEPTYEKAPGDPDQRTLADGVTEDEDILDDPDDSGEWESPNGTVAPPATPRRAPGL